MNKRPERPVYIYSRKEENLKQLGSFFQQIKIPSTTSVSLEPLEQIYSIYIFCFESFLEFQEYKKIFPFSQTTSVLVHLVPLNSTWYENLADIVLTNNQDLHILKLAVELAYLRELEHKTKSHNHSKFLIQKKSIYSLTTSLSQGSGLGTSVTLIDMIDMQKKDCGKYYEINKEIIELLIKNNEHSRNLLEGLQNMVELLENSISLEKIFISKFLDKIPSFIERITSYFPKKNIELILQKEEVEGYLEINEEKIQLVIEELLLNAYKYSIVNSKIEFYLTSHEENFILKVRNQVHPEFYGGVPPELEKLVREPFVRIYPPGDEHFPLVKFGLGLGLTAIDYIVNQHNGFFSIRDEVVSGEKDNENFVVAEIILPIVE